METALTEITLVLFTTIAPAGVVGYLIMAASIMRSRDDARANAIGRYLVVPLVLAITGLIASATHLGTPANALYVITGIGRSPLSNEVVAAVVFLALGGIYWILSFRDDLRRSFRIAWLSATVAAGLAFVGYIAAAYSVPSVSTWNLPTAPLTLWLNALSSGPFVGLFGLLLARQEPSKSVAVALAALAALAAAGNGVVLVTQWQELPGIVTTTTRAVDLVPAMPLVIGAYVAFEAVAVALGGAGALLRGIGASDDPFAAAQRTRAVRLALTATSAVLALAACFAVRFTFYALHMTLGI